jgi:hypothetical protein
VLAWYAYFEECGYAILTEEKAGYMVDYMSQETQQIYNEVCVPFSIDEVLKREVVEPVADTEKNIQHTANDDNKEKLVQFNVRVKENIAKAFRSFCKERGITQSEGLRLLLMCEDFENRILIAQSYQKEINDLKVENDKLRASNEELLELKKGEESWLMHQRKDWVNVSKAMLDQVIKRSVRYRADFTEKVRPLSFKSKLGYKMFCDHQYPVESGCYEVCISGRVWGVQGKDSNVKKSTHIFICGRLKDNTLVKFRWFHMKDFVGVRPNDEQITNWGKDWLLGCVKAKDGAMDLVCSVPLSGISNYKTRYDLKIESNIDAEIEAEMLIIDRQIEAELLAMENENRKPKLDAQIAVASRRSQK